MSASRLIARDRSGTPLSQADLPLLMLEAESYLRGALAILDEAEKHCSRSFITSYSAVVTSITALSAFTETKKMLRNVPSIYYSKVYCSLVRKVFSAAANNWAVACCEHPTLSDKIPLQKPICPSFYQDELTGAIKVGAVYQGAPKKEPLPLPDINEITKLGNPLEMMLALSKLSE